MTRTAAMRHQDVLDRFHAGQRTGLARAISIVEDEREGFQALLHEVLRGGAHAERVGLTGPPGAGKSTLLATMANRHRAADERVGVVAVDPTSPYSGGALLGDRIRMNDLATDRGIFIRSMATRGSLGGLATKTKEVIDLMDAFGFDRILIETVGVGQTQLEITGAADTVVVVLVPESGDAVQAMKAGLMEIADIFVVNKADRPGAQRLAKEIRQAVHLREPGDGRRGGGDAGPAASGHHGVDLATAGRGAEEGRSIGTGSRRWEPPEGWRIPVLETVAQSGDGVDELMEAIEGHRTHLLGSGELEERRRARAERRVRAVVDRDVRRLVWESETATSLLETGLEGVASGRETPYSVAARIVESVLGRGREDRAGRSVPESG